MEEEKRNIPEVRFREFAGDNADAWEQRKLGEVSKITAGGDVDKEKLLLHGKFPVIANALTNDGIVGYYNDTYRITAPAVTVTGRGEIGKAKARRNNFTPVVRLLTVESKHNVDFLAEAINRSKVVFESTGVPQLTVPKLSNYKILFPNSIDEEIEVGNFLSRLDSLIDLHQRELDNFKALKKTLLSKMFPKNDEKYPEIRFSGFTDAWELRKLEEIIDTIIDFRGRTPKKLGLKWSRKGYLALSAQNVKNGYIDKNIEAHHGNQKLYDKWMRGKELHKGQVIFTTEAPMGNVAQIPDDSKYILSQRTIAFKVKDNIVNENYFATLLRSPKIVSRLLSLASGGTAKGVSQKSLARLQLELPVSIEEQQKIGTFFKNLDELITLHQRELDNLKILKKTLLSKMFV